MLVLKLYVKFKGLLQNKPRIQNVIIFVPNWPKPTKRNYSYVAKVLVLFGAKIARYGSCDYFVRNLKHTDYIFLMTVH